MSNFTLIRIEMEVLALKLGKKNCNGFAYTVIVLLCQQLVFAANGLKEYLTNFQVF